jgi:thioesterase domain-containing protein
MLIPIQPSGTKPPIFLIHGNSGFMPTGTVFARVMGPDRPVYVINAKGFDGSEPRSTVEEMVGDYLAEIFTVTTSGPISIVGQCWGSLVALELATELLARGCEMGPVVLMDPPRVPFGRAAVAVGDDVARQLYDYTKGSLITLSKNWFLEMPFDANDPEQLHDAVVTGVASITAISKFTPRPFLGDVEMILSADSAGAFFGRERPWQRVLPNPIVYHVMPFGHIEMLHNHRFDVARFVRLILEWNARRGMVGGMQDQFGTMQNRFGRLLNPVAQAASD